MKYLRIWHHPSDCYGEGGRMERTEHEAVDMAQAVADTRVWLLAMPTLDPFDYDDLLVVPADMVVSIDVEAIASSRRAAHLPAIEAEQEARDRAEYERLKAKFEAVQARGIDGAVIGEVKS